MAERPIHVAPLVSRAWMFTFADLLALMLTFFVLLFSMSAVESERWQALVATLSERLKPIRTWQEPVMAQRFNAERKLVPRAVDLGYLGNVLQEKMADNAILAEARLNRLGDRLVVSLPADFLFEAGDDRLREAGRPAIAALADALRVVANRIDVLGHSDPTPVPDGARFPSNWELSLARAIAVANALNESGYPFTLRAQGVADARFRDLPMSLSPQERRELGRRVDLVIREGQAERLGDAR